MGTNYYARIIPTKERKEKLKELKQNGTQTKKNLIAKLGKSVMGFGFNLAMKAKSIKYEKDSWRLFSGLSNHIALGRFLPLVGQPAGQRNSGRILCSGENAPGGYSAGHHQQDDRAVYEDPAQE